MENFLTLEEFAAAVTLSQQLHWMRIAEDGVVELYLDHHALAMYRNCPARFYEEMVRGYKVKVSPGSGTGFWSLEFGILFHQIMEYYYKHFREPDFSLNILLDYASTKWHEGNFEFWAEDKGYKNLGGLFGLKALVAMYHTRFGPENERLRIIGTELYFGKGKEVPLQIQPEYGLPFRLYYSGKIDLVIDDGNNIAPLDHKTHGDFRGRGRDPQDRFYIQEGMTGYIYALKYMVRNIMQLDVSSRALNMILMNHIQVKSASIQDRFKRIPLYKSNAELENWRKRQISTARDILAACISSITHNLPFYYNASVCTNWYMSTCLYHKVHRVDPLVQITILENEYERKPIWNPETRDEREGILNSLEHL